MLSARFRLLTLSLSLFGLAACGEPTSDSGRVTMSVDSTVPTRAQTLALACSGCHSDQSGAIASLAGYSEDMLTESLSRYKTEADGTTVMHRLARGYSDEDIAAIALYLSGEGKVE